MNIRTTIFQAMLYLIVGALATVVEWGTFYILNAKLCVYYMLATALSFIASTFANWIFGRFILFRNSSQSKIKELAKIYTVSIAGLLMNLLLMYLFIEKLNFWEMYSKIFATGIVFVWNFLIRKLLIYKI